MKIMGKGSNSAAARKMIADERHTLKWSHLVVSRRPFVGTVFARVSEVGTCTSCGRPASIAPDCSRRRSRCGASPPPVYATRPTMPMVPAWMSTRSDCAKTASPMVNVERSGASAAAENEKPGLAVRFQAPSGVWRQIDPFEHEMRIGNEKSPFVGEPVRLHQEIGRSGVRNRHCVFDVKFTLPAVIEQTKRRIAALLDFRNYEPRSDRVYRPGGHEDDVVRRYGPPHDKSSRSSRRRRPHAIAAESFAVSGRAATLASGAALRTYQASDFPLGRPSECANASSG